MSLNSNPQSHNRFQIKATIPSQDHHTKSILVEYQPEEDVLNDALLSFYQRFEELKLEQIQKGLPHDRPTITRLLKKERRERSRKFYHARASI